VKEQIVFRNREDFRSWLMDNHSRGEGIWLTFSKKKELQTIRADEALEEALCFGWIDGQINSIDDTVYLKYFAPRRKGSRWSERNKGIVERLIADGSMTEWGMKAIERAKQDGIWDDLRQSPITQEQIDYFSGLISVNETAFLNFQKMSMSVKKQFVGLYFDAKKEDTRVRRLEKLLGLLEQNKRPM
jgi:uncharacterized protein YdeI (YjbR/CyaY-like superfamily)